MTTVVVLHDLNLAARYCDQLVLLDRGEVVCSGTPDTVLSPEVLEPVYKISVRRIVEPDCIQLVFAPEPGFLATESVGPAPHGRSKPGHR